MIEIETSIEHLNDSLKPIIDIQNKMEKMLAPYVRLNQVAAALKLNFPMRLTYRHPKAIDIQSDQKKIYKQIVTSLESEQVDEISTSQTHQETIKELKERIKSLEKENKIKDDEINILKKRNKTIERLGRCAELRVLMSVIKNNPGYSITQLSKKLHKSEATIKTQLKEICEKIYCIDKESKNKGLKRVRLLVENDI